MIAVIADDLTGAAELAGIGLRYFSKIQVFADNIESSDADLIVVSTDSRSMSKEDAVQKTATVTAKLANLNPQFIFKKVDSALRGHVVSEIEAQLKQLHLNKALLVPANPALGRKIIKGIYYLNDEPIHLTGFSEDPEFPITTSVVSRMLPSGDMPLHVVSHLEPMPASGIIVGEVEATDDLDAWAQKKKEDVMLAGGSGFFIAVLNAIESATHHDHASDDSWFGGSTLFVCGSAYNRSIELVKSLKKKGGPVSYIPVTTLRSSFQTWTSEVVSLLNTYGKAVIAIDPEMAPERSADAKFLREATAAAVHAVYNEKEIQELIIEGGSTASAIVKKLGFQSFLPVQEISAGVVRMKVEGSKGMHLTIKPGSYAWSEKIWTFHHGLRMLLILLCPLSGCLSKLLMPN